MDYERTDSDFESNGTRCAGWLYRPETTDSPVVARQGDFLERHLDA